MLHLVKCETASVTSAVLNHFMRLTSDATAHDVNRTRDSNHPSNHRHHTNQQCICPMAVTLACFEQGKRSVKILYNSLEVIPS